MALPTEVTKQIREAAQDLATLAATAADPGTRPMNALAVVVDAIAALQDIQGDLVVDLRSYGSSWPQIAECLRVTPQAVSKRYSSAVEAARAARYSR